MLDQVVPVEVSEQLWASIPSRAALPWDEDEYFSAAGMDGVYGETRRQYLRIHMREKGVMVRDSECHAIYAKNASPKGIGLFSPVQLFPGDRVKVLLDEQAAMDVELRRCRRIKEACYECGTVFVDGVIPPAIFQRLIQSQRRRQ